MCVLYTDFSDDILSPLTTCVLYSLGELITMAGLNQEQMPFSKSFLKSPNKSFAAMSALQPNGSAPHRTPQHKDNLRPG